MNETLYANSKRLPGPKRGKCVWCSLSHSHTCRPQRCLVSRRLNGVGTNLLLKHCKILKEDHGVPSEEIKRELIASGEGAPEVLRQRFGLPPFPVGSMRSSSRGVSDAFLLADLSLGKRNQEAGLSVKREREQEMARAMGSKKRASLVDNLATLARYTLSSTEANDSSKDSVGVMGMMIAGNQSQSSDGRPKFGSSLLLLSSHEGHHGSGSHSVKRESGPSSPLHLSSNGQMLPPVASLLGGLMLAPMRRGSQDSPAMRTRNAADWFESHNSPIIFANVVKNEPVRVTRSMSKEMHDISIKNLLA